MLLFQPVYCNYHHRLLAIYHPARQYPEQYPVPPEYARNSHRGFAAQNRVRQIANGLSDYMVTLDSAAAGRITLAEVSGQLKLLPREYINAVGNMVTPAFPDYAKPLIGNIQPLVRLQGVPVTKRLLMM